MMTSGSPLCDAVIEESVDYVLVGGAGSLPHRLLLGALVVGADLWVLIQHLEAHEVLTRADHLKHRQAHG